MNKICLVVVLFFATTLFGQERLKIKVSNSVSKEALVSATVSINSLRKNTATDSLGLAIFQSLPQGKYVVAISFVGFEEKEILISIPFTDAIMNIELVPLEEEEEEVIIQSTRTSRTIKNVPTRIETIELEEIDEKSNMRPNNVSMLLHESTGIQVQQTSATSGNASIRIQGLDGRYTQLLKDGFASFGNFASGLSILEIPPLDLKQVEIIKGPASTLFGGGAIAGVVNFISKTPKEKKENNLILNQSNIGQTNLSYYSSKKNKKTGYTFLGMVNNQKLYDVDKDDFSEVPKSIEVTLHPKFFIYLNEKTTFIIGNNFSRGIRTGGDVQVLKKRADTFHQFFEENNTVRNSTTVEFQKQISDKKWVTIKSAYSIFNRHIKIPDYHFDGTSYNSFTDISVLNNFSKHSIVYGGNVVYDKFDENRNSSLERDNKNFTSGVFVQDTWDGSEKIKLESGLRFDWAKYSNNKFSNSEFFMLPRVSVLVKYNNKLSSRIGAGMGYKVPSLFTEQTETMQYRNIQQIENVASEKSYGATADFNFRSKLGSELELSFNQLFFYTLIKNPLILEENRGFGFSFVNVDKAVDSKGFETNAKFIYKNNFKLFLGYTFTNAKAKYLVFNKSLPLVPKHKLNSALIYEKHEFVKLGLEGYYTGHQFLPNGTKTDDFWEFGFMAEKIWERFSLYINFENFTDTRQSKYKQVVNGAHPAPTFDEIWTHTEGFSINGGIKLRL